MDNEIEYLGQNSRMRYEVHLNGTLVISKKGILNQKKLLEYLTINDLLVDTIDYDKEEVVVYKLRDRSHGFGV